VINVDKDKNEKSDLGNDKHLNREKNKVTGVKTIDQRKEKKDKDDGGKP
jgi:hypothetical protein